LITCSLFVPVRVTPLATKAKASFTLVPNVSGLANGCISNWTFTPVVVFSIALLSELISNETFLLLLASGSLILIAYLFWVSLSPIYWVKAAEATLIFLVVGSYTKVSLSIFTSIFVLVVTASVLISPSSL
jgi:hypothetical protein